jgi:hypothetical protein
MTSNYTDHRKIGHVTDNVRRNYAYASMHLQATRDLIQPQANDLLKLFRYCGFSLHGSAVPFVLPQMVIQ